MHIISSFSGEYRFLSNFYVHPDGMTVEHEYQAAKSCSLRDYKLVMSAATPGEAKRVGGSIRIRDDWNSIKVTVMEQLLIKKFAHESLAVMLLLTGDAPLIEGNRWGDTFWGVCDGVGHNMLGKILMKIRNEFINLEFIATY